jgi:hypothetical protein
MGLQGLTQQQVPLVLVADFLDPERDLVPNQQLTTKHVPIVDLELQAQLLDVLGVEGGRQPQDWGQKPAAENMDQERRDALVEGAEIVASLRNAVGLVDHDQADFLPDPLEDELKDPVRRQSLGGEENQVGHYTVVEVD